MLLFNKARVMVLSVQLQAMYVYSNRFKLQENIWPVEKERSNKNNI